MPTTAIDETPLKGHQPLTHLPARIGPRSKFHFALLIVKGKPRDVNLASGLEDAGGDVEAIAVARNDYFCLVRSIEPFIGTSG